MEASSPANCKSALIPVNGFEKAAEETVARTDIPSGAEAGIHSTRLMARLEAAPFQGRGSRALFLTNFFYDDAVFRMGIAPPDFDGTATGRACLSCACPS